MSQYQYVALFWLGVTKKDAHLCIFRDVQLMRSFSNRSFLSSRGRPFFESVWMDWSQWTKNELQANESLRRCGIIRLRTSGMCAVIESSQTNTIRYVLIPLALSRSPSFEKILGRSARDRHLNCVAVFVALLLSEWATPKPPR